MKTIPAALKVWVVLTIFLTSEVICAQLVSIDLVTVGDPGQGGVDYSYQMGKYEVTISQYTTFLNATASSDPYNLYNSQMGSDLMIAGIQRSGSSGNYTYSIIGNGNKPITYVSWFDAARFANWMQNGATLGASTETGAYTLNGATSGVSYTTNPGAIWYLPSLAEWQKAGYYQPTSAGGDADGWWKYSTQSNTTPTNPNGSTTNSNTGNFKLNNNYAVTGSSVDNPNQNYLTEAGAYTLADSYYGTFDQGGNAYEWNAAVVGGERGRSGGAWNSDEFYIELQASTGHLAPTDEYRSTGFRLASVIPEPSTFGMIGLAMVSLLYLGRKKISFFA